MYMRISVYYLYLVGVEIAQMVKEQDWYARRLGSEFDPPWIKAKYLSCNYMLIYNHSYKATEKWGNNSGFHVVFISLLYPLVVQSKRGSFQY